MMGLMFGAELFALSGEEILALVDKNLSFSSIEYVGIMEIHSGDRVRTKEMDVKALGAGKAFVRFTNPEDRGTKYLKIDKNLWIYFPSEQETVKISGHMLKEGMMGSDVSYEDALESGDFAQTYSIRLSGEEAVGDRPCYVIQLDAKKKDAPYDKRKMWIDKERFVNLKEEMYAKSGKLLKTGRTLAVESIQGRYYGVSVELSDALKKNTKTVFHLKSVRFDTKLDEGMFSLRNLQR